MFNISASGCLPKLCLEVLASAFFCVIPVFSAYAGLTSNSSQISIRSDSPRSLFSSASHTQADKKSRVVRDKQVDRWRSVNIDAQLLTASADFPAGMPQSAKVITLNLFDDVNFVAEADRIEITPRGVVWFGHLKSVENSAVVIVANGDVVSGNITMPQASYQIRNVGPGMHEVRRIDQRRFPRDELFVPTPSEADLEKKQLNDQHPNAQADDGATIDVLVVYSGAARAAAGSTAAIQILIDLAVSETNQSYTNSGINQRLRLVHSEEVSYAETGRLTDALNCVSSTTDGCLDSVHTLRNTYGADLVSFWVENGDACGLGWFMGTVSASFERYGFSVVARSCATGYYSFGHELGHNMGATHDRYVDSSATPYPYNHGYVNTSARWRTVMAYNNACSDIGKNCTRIQYWSNPTLLYGGNVLGDSGADNHQVLNNTAQTVANFRASVSNNSTVIEFYNTNLDNYFITASVSEAAVVDGGSAGPGWIRTGYTFKSGGANAVCRFYGSMWPGPNSHFYTADANECAGLKQLQATTPASQPRWNFESLDFLTTHPANRSCPTGTIPVYRAYNNGFARGVDSNHRFSISYAAIQEVLNRGWISEGVVMCAPG